MLLIEEIRGLLVLLTVSITLECNEGLLAIDWVIDVNNKIDGKHEQEHLFGIWTQKLFKCSFLRIRIKCGSWCVILIVLRYWELLFFVERGEWVHHWFIQEIRKD